MAEKKEVMYSAGRGVMVIGDRAYLYPINHPGPYVSNTTQVMTSKVQHFNSKTGRLETENTIYSPDCLACFHKVPKADGKHYNPEQEFNKSKCEGERHGAAADIRAACKEERF